MVQILQQQFENENELRKYPFEETASLVDDDGNSLLDSILVDASFCIVNRSSIVTGEWQTMGPEVVPDVFLSSLHISGGIVSVSIVAKPVNLAPYSMVGTYARKEITPFTPIPMFSEDGVVFGILTFGDLNNVIPATYSFSSSSQSGFSAHCIQQILGGGFIERFIDDASGNIATGDVTFSFPSEFNVAVKKEDKRLEKYVNEIELNPDDSVRQSVCSKCKNPDDPNSCLAPTIKSINGISPNASGEIAIVFN